jgi:hypothetical protein
MSSPNPLLGAGCGREIPSLNLITGSGFDLQKHDLNEQKLFMRLIG